MHFSRNRLVGPRTVKVVAAVVVGLSVGTLLPPDAVAVPLVGTVSGVVVGGVGLATGAGLYLWVPGLLAGPDCGCSGDCGCS